MLLSRCLEGLHHTILKGDMHCPINKVVFDSREVTEASLFVAITGFSVDGHDYIQNAVAQGAVAIVVEKEIEVDAPITIILVKNTRIALACASANFYNRPSEKLNMVGITGTNGKTSITYFIKSILESSKKHVGIIGTIGNTIGDIKLETKNTTPESLTLQSILNDMVNASVDYCVMEVSSHALDLNRVAYCQFNTGIYTNLTPDHLELHKDMNCYFEAKAKLFFMTKQANIINCDDPYGRVLIDRLKANSEVPILTYGLHEHADVYANEIQYAFNGTRFMAYTPKGRVEIICHIPGEIYVYNALAAVAWAVSEDLSLEVIAKGIASLEGVKGRFETVYDAEDKKVVVDFAHTEDGLQKALQTLRPFVKNRLLLVFGVYAAPGEAGLSKRVGMGKVAATEADFCYVTSDNPKTQDPMAIINDVTGAIAFYNGAYLAMVDRQQAIEHALENMCPGDILLISGKGHETAQVIGKVDVPFNETEIVREKMKNLKVNG